MAASNKNDITANRISVGTENGRLQCAEAVPYCEDLPECIGILPELIDGAVAQGAASKVKISIFLDEA